MALAMTLTEPESWHSVECHAGVGTGSFYALSKEKEPPTDSQARLGCVCLDPFNSFFYKKIENEKAKTLIYYFPKKNNKNHIHHQTNKGKEATCNEYRALYTGSKGNKDKTELLIPL